MRNRFLLACTLCGFLALVSTLARAQEPESAAAAAPVFPGTEWRSKQPAEVGLDATKLNALARYVGGFGCVVRGGCLAYSWGEIDRPVDVASACKPWFAHFIFKAIEEGKLKSLDDRLVDVEPELSNLNPSLDHKDREIRWRHLASQTSCYGVEERPGTAYDYSDFNMALFYDNLMFKVYGATPQSATSDVLHRLLTDELECQDSPRFSDRGRLAISVRDFARFGLLYLRGGEWQGKQLLSPASVKTLRSSPLPNSIPRTLGKPAEMLPGQRTIGGGSNQTDHLGSYSFTWWVNGVDRNGRRHWPDAPLDTFGAFGHNSKRAMVVLPTQDLIITWNESNLAGPEMANRALQLLLDAATD